MDKILNNNFALTLNECLYEIEEDVFGPTIFTDFISSGMTQVYLEITDREKLKTVVN